MRGREARARFIDSMMKLTVWIRQRNDKRWEAIDYIGQCLAVENTREEMDRVIRAMARDIKHNIWCITYVTDPKDRRQFRNKPTRRSL